MVAKLSSASTIAAASRETSVPLRPMAMPMSAALSAGASFTPSPVIATTCPSACSARTIASFCSGSMRANTRAPATALRSISPSSTRSSRPVSTGAPRGAMPSSAAMAPAAAGWSPVIISTRMPASCAAATAAKASGRGGSIMPTSPSQTSDSSCDASTGSRPGSRR